LPTLTHTPVASGREHTILVVEDDPAVRSLVKEVLLQNEYRVIEAESADEALMLWPAHRDEVELLLTDIVMPGAANGIELAEMLLGDKPELKVIYTSGYSGDLFTSDVQLHEGYNYLPKPYLSSKLTSILRNALEPAELVF
ncbi:MAG TPA: response regulator, partial [Chthoniobacteraceae bacterium]